VGLLPLVALFLIRVAGGFQFQAVAVATPMLVAHGLSYAQTGALLGAFVLPGIIVTVPAGVLAQRFGDGRVLAGGLLLMALGGLLTAAAPGFPAMLAARVLSGIGGVAILMLLIKMTADRYAGPMLSTASGIIVTSWPAGIAVCLVALGPFASLLGWRGTLAVSGLPALVALGLLPFTGPGQGRHASPIAHAASPPPAFVALAASTWGAFNASMAVMVGFLPAYLVSVGLSPARAAAMASVAVWTQAVALPFGGYLADRFIGQAVAVIGGMALMAALLCAIPMVDGTVPALVALGLAFAIAPGPLTAQVGLATPPAARAVVFGWYSGTAFLGMTVGPWIAGIIRDATGDAAAPLLFAAMLALMMLPLYGGFRRAASPLRRTWQHGSTNFARPPTVLVADHECRPDQIGQPSLTTTQETVHEKRLPRL
jgi:MFS family permease